MKKVLFCLIIGVLISNVYAEKSKIVKHLKFNEPLKYYTYWDPNEGISPGIDILIAKNDNEFYAFSYAAYNWYHFHDDKYEKLFEIDETPSETGKPIYYFSDDVVVLGLINLLNAENKPNGLQLYVKTSKDEFKISKQLPEYYYVFSENYIYYTGNDLLILLDDNETIRMNIKSEKEYEFFDKNETSEWLKYNSQSLGLSKIENYYSFGDYLITSYSKPAYINFQDLKIDAKGRKYHIYYDLKYESIGKDCYGCSYFRLLKNDAKNHNIKYSIAVHNAWTNEIKIYDDYDVNDWNPPRIDGVDDDELKFIGTYPWTVGADGAIYFFDADDKKREYQIKKIENRWHKDFGIDKKQIGHCNSNDIPLYTEKNVTSKTEVFNYCNDCLLILKKEDKFCKVRKIDGREGWIEAKYIDFAEDEPTKSAAAKTNVAVNMKMSCADNLRLRSEEVTSSKIITTMAKGTKVKILKLGKAETIDGINSNWVQVEILSGAKDIDGKAIQAGTTGWCYGGYLVF